MKDSPLSPLPIQADLGDTAGLGPDHSNKAGRTNSFGFPRTHKDVHTVSKCGSIMPQKAMYIP